MVAFGRAVCGNLEISSKREWLVTNGIGGYASGTVAGILTRTYHGLLIAALLPPLGRTLLLTKLDESVTYGENCYPLFSNRWASGQVEPQGFDYLERFHLEGRIPVWTYALGDVLIQKRIWMQPGENSTYVQYAYVRPPAMMPFSAPGSLKLYVKVIVNYRDHHAVTRMEDLETMHVEPVGRGLELIAFDGAVPFTVLAGPSSPLPEIKLRGQWYQGYYLSVEAYRGLAAVDNHFYAGHFEVQLNPGQSFTVIAACHPEHNEPVARLMVVLPSEAALEAHHGRERNLLERAGLEIEPGPPEFGSKTASKQEQEAIAQLILAADQFIVRRGSSTEPEGYSIIAGYPWFGDWGRDTMISLPGLTLVTGRSEIARSILITFAAFVDQGMLPNRFPDAGQAPEYNTADATLWYFEAVRAYHAATGDEELLRRLYPLLAEIIDWHLRGTRYKIQCDPADGLLYAGEPGLQLTWMDAKVGERVFTPRIGKPVEINALWYNALRIMAVFAESLGKMPRDYERLAERTRVGFERFWNESSGYCFDVLDGPQGNDPALRPNQLLAVSLLYSPLSFERGRAVVDACARHLLTSHGLRSLAPSEPGYQGHYGGDRLQRDAAYHQGTVWGWLIGPFVSAHLRIYGDPCQARTYLTPLLQYLDDHGLGTISEIFDGDPPFTPHGCFAQAWSVAEVLRAWKEIQTATGQDA